MKHLVFLFSFLLLCQSLQADNAQKIALGRLIFNDKTLSTPEGQACSSCHQSASGFADTDNIVSPGANPKRFGNRNAPSIAYIAFTPELHWDKEELLWVGGFFLDGRARTLQEQAKGPFLNPLEMANPDAETVINKIRKGNYATLFQQVYGSAIWQDSDQAFQAVADAISHYERSPELSPFTSKYDAFLKGKANLTAQEQKGLELFEAEDKGNCAACHPSQVGDDQSPPLFTDFTYDNLGVPANPALPYYNMGDKHNPLGKAYIDEGLSLNPHIHKTENERGKFKVSTLRNIAKTAPYMHNGALTSLRDVVDFYSNRDVKDQWGKPEVIENMNTEELGDLKLSDDEIDAIVAFLETLSDGYTTDKQ